MIIFKKLKEMLIRYGIQREIYAICFFYSTRKERVINIEEKKSKISSFSAFLYAQISGMNDMYDN